MLGWIRRSNMDSMFTEKIVSSTLTPVEKKTAKAIKRWVKDAHLQFAYYLDTLNNFHTYLCQQKLIKSTLHTVRRVHMCKVGLTEYDTKRWLCDDTIHTHAHGHRSTLL